MRGVPVAVAIIVTPNLLMVRSWCSATNSGPSRRGREPVASSSSRVGYGRAPPVVEEPGPVPGDGAPAPAPAFGVAELIRSATFP